MKKKITAIVSILLASLLIGSSFVYAEEAEDAVYTVGICQLVQHNALDAATQGFKDALIEALGEEHVIFDEQNAAGDSATCATITAGFAASEVDLIMANATPALQAAASATSTIPILGTSVTDYGTALNLNDFSGTVGGNISGTSDLAPLDQQAQIIKELFPEAQTVGIMYCSGEANSVYQATTIRTYLEEEGYTVEEYTFADSNDVAFVTQSACDECDVLFLPTDNTAASCTSAIDAVARPTRTPIVTGEENMCVGCGVATLTISYYDLGKVTGQMAAKVLTGEEEISEMPIQWAAETVKKYNPEICADLGIEIPDSYEALEIAAE
ncbi:MAG: ABC transporter substrate-binding protein [Parasporobacterium sp.]|nr:ABC transporter substrate-binding protein [Parasporobacterium sp.]